MFWGGKVEWRHKKGKTNDIVGIITRLNVSENPETPDKKTSYLVVSKLTADKICVVGKIPPQADQNQKARTMVEKSVNMPCIDSTKSSGITQKSTTNSSQLIGSWVEPIPGNEKEFQGFTLHKDGSAESINMATLLYKKWKIEGNQIILTVESIGNATSSTDKESYRFDFCEKGYLCLTDKASSNTFKYKKR